MIENCQNCNDIITGGFCSNCGQTAKLARIDKNYAKNEFFNLIGYESGFIFTVKELLLHPKQSISTYLLKNRKKLTKPITFLGITSVIYTLISHYFQTDLISEQHYKNMYGTSNVTTIMIWIQNNFAYSNILMILFIASWLKIFFRKSSKYNFYEIIVILCFLMGQTMLLISI